MFPSELQCGRNARGRHVVVCLVFRLLLSLLLFIVEKVKNKQQQQQQNPLCRDRGAKSALCLTL